MLRELLSAAKQPLIIAGSLQNAGEAEAVEQLALDLQVPLYADLSSGLRLKSTTLPWQLAFQLPQFTGHFKPDLVLHVGGHIISKHPAAAIREWKPEHYIVIKPHASRFSPDHNVTLSIDGSIVQTTAALKGCRATLSGKNISKYRRVLQKGWKGD